MKRNEKVLEEIAPACKVGCPEEKMDLTLEGDDMLVATCPACKAQSRMLLEALTDEQLAALEESMPPGSGGLMN